MTRDAEQQKYSEIVALVSVIVAGYPNEIQRFINSNPGLSGANAVVCLWHGTDQLGGLAMSVDWGRPEAVGGASNRGF